jgi:putative ABC transport system permease protein
MNKTIIIQNLEAGLVSFRNNPLRSALTMIGIVVGISAVVAVLSIGKGNEAKVEAQVNKMGASLFWIEPQSRFSVNQVGASMALSMSNYMYHLSVMDVELIKEQCPLVKYVAPETSFYVQGVLDEKSVQVNIIATTPEYEKVKSLHLIGGRYICDMDVKDVSNVCVVEENPGMNLESAVGHGLTINGTAYRIVGIIKKQNAFLPSFASMVAYAPLSAVRNLGGENSVQSIYCLADEASEGNYVERAKHQVERALMTNYRLSESYSEFPKGDFPFQILSSRDIFERAESMVKTATMVTAGIGMLSLFVGGIGIMNILLASVTERTREIGVRKTVGARKRDVMLQYLFESIMLSAAGGILGVVGGIFIGKTLSSLIHVPSVFSLDSVLIGILFSIATGTIFGVYPAWKAAKMAPIDALRYE